MQNNNKAFIHREEWRECQKLNEKKNFNMNKCIYILIALQTSHAYMSYVHDGSRTFSVFCFNFWVLLSNCTCVIINCFNRFYAERKWFRALHEPHSRRMYRSNSRWHLMNHIRMTFEFFFVFISWIGIELNRMMNKTTHKCPFYWRKEKYGSNKWCRNFNIYSK